MKEFWDRVMSGIEDKYVDETAKAYLKAEPEEIRLIKIAKTESERKSKKSHKGLMALGIAAAAVILTAAVTLGIGLFGKGREIPVLSAPEVPLYAEKYVSPEELYYCDKSEVFFNYDGRGYFMNNSYVENCFFRMDSEGLIYEAIDYYDKTEHFTILTKINGIKNINELEEINGIEISGYDYRFYILPDKRIVGIHPFDEKAYSEGYFTDTTDLYEADFFYCNENVAAISISKMELASADDYPNLKKLYIRSDVAEGLKQISDGDIDVFKASGAYSSIEILTLDSGVNLSPGVIEKMPALREVRMKCGQVYDMAYMQSLPHLRRVDISTEDIRGIKELRELTSLNLSAPSSQVGAEKFDITGFEELAEIPSLKELTLVGSMNTDKLSLLKNVEKLNVTCVTDTLSFINDMTSLRELTVSDDYLKEFGLSSDNYTVERLSIIVFDSVMNFEELKRFKAIKEVNLNCTMAITNKPRIERIIKEFKELYPEAKVTADIHYYADGVVDEYFIKALERAELPESPDMAEIENLLSDFREFSYGYLSAKTAKEHISGNYIESDEVIYNCHFIWRNEVPTKWYRLASGEITTQYQLFEKLYSIFNSEGIGCLGLDNIYRATMGELYLSENAGNDGGVLGADMVALESVERIDDYSLLLTFSASVDKDSRDLPDYADSFKITLENTTEGLRISDIDLKGIDYLTWIPVDYSRCIV